MQQLVDRISAESNGRCRLRIHEDDWPQVRERIVPALNALGYAIGSVPAAQTEGYVTKVITRSKEGVITATRARAIAEEHRMNRAPTLMSILTDIGRASSHGEMSLAVRGLSPELVSKLQSLGYRLNLITTSHQLWRIFW